MNQMKTRLQSLGLLDRALRAMTDDELSAAVEGLDDEHREAVERVAGASDVESLRTAIGKGRMDGTMESIAMVLTDASLADCIKELGENADNPSSDQLRAVLPGIVERHGVPITRAMLAPTVAGEAQAATIIRDLMKHDDVLKLPAAEPRPSGPIPRAPQVADAEREAIRARRQEQKQKKQDAARLRREQSARDRGRV